MSMQIKLQLSNLSKKQLCDNERGWSAKDDDGIRIDSGSSYLMTSFSTLQTGNSRQYVTLERFTVEVVGLTMSYS